MSREKSSFARCSNQLYFVGFSAIFHTSPVKRGRGKKAPLRKLLMDFTELVLGPVELLGVLYPKQTWWDSGMDIPIVQMMDVRL